MADNLSDKFAKMSDAERRRFALEPDRAPSELDKAPELEFDNPRNDPGRTKANMEDRDGAAALLDDEKHDEAVRAAARSRPKPEHAPE